MPTRATAPGNLLANILDGGWEMKTAMGWMEEEECDG